MSSVRFLDLVKPIVPYLPEIRSPETPVAFERKLIWTGISLIIFLVMSQMPLYGIVSSDSSDPLYWLRQMMASNRGTLMELGTTPIISSGIVFQFLQATESIDADLSNKTDRELYQSAQKALALIIAFGQAIVYVSSGLYGPPSELGVGVCILLVAQLVVASLLVVLLDEVLQKGYGLGSGISLFIATNVCESIVWKAFSPTTVNTGRGAEFEGAIVNLVHLVFAWPDKRLALREAFFRQNQPNVMNVLATVVVFGAVMYLQSFHVSIALSSKQQKGANTNYPIKLFYTSNMPIMLQQALSSNVFIASQLLFSWFSDNLLVRLFGVWEPIVEGSSQLHAVSGLVYYMTPPLSISQALLDPIHTVVYLVYMVAACSTLSKMWILTNGAPKDVVKSLQDKGLELQNAAHSGRLFKVFNESISDAARFGGAAIGLLSVGCDMIGALGSGTSILLAVTIIYGYFEIAAQEGQLFDMKKRR